MRPGPATIVPAVTRGAGTAAVRRLLRDATEAIHTSEAVGERPRWESKSDAEDLLALATGDDDAAETLEELTRREQRRFARLLKRRVDGEPIALIRGYVEFCGLRVKVSPGVFAPRPSSELLAQSAIRRLRRRAKPVAVDVATGAGPVALAVGDALSDARVVGVDISREAVEIARRNARRLGLDNVRFKRGDLLDALPGKLAGRVDVMTVHPPYVPRAEVRLMPKEVTEFEPRHTLTDGSVDGLGMVRRLVAASPEWLRDGGWLLVEVSPDRAKLVAGVLRDGGTVEVLGTRGDPTRVLAMRR